MLRKIYPPTNHHRTGYLLLKDNMNEETAEDLMEKEAGYFIYNTMLLNNKLLHIPSSHLPRLEEYEHKNERFHLLERNAEDHYRWIKELHGEIQAAFLKLPAKKLPYGNSRLSLYISSIRNAMHAAKSIKDITDNISQLSRSSKTLKFDFFTSFQLQTDQLNKTLADWLQSDNKPGYDKILSSSKEIEANYTQLLNRFYLEASGTQLSEIEITTLINFSRECFSANRSILMALKDIILNEEEAIKFNDEPSFIS
ncbi:MAG: hypothetical protein ACKO1T_04635 [Sediminibacterium sp.]